MKNIFLRTAAFVLAGFIAFPVQASEVAEKTATKVVVREHPQTGIPYVSIVSTQSESTGPLAAFGKRYPRPDYRMLNPKIKSKDVGYAGPSSDRKKVYVLAASLAAVGTAGGVAVLAAAPVATGAGASGGAGAFAAGGAGVVTGTAAVAVKTATPKNENYIHRSQSVELPEKEKAAS